MRTSASMPQLQDLASMPQLQPIKGLVPFHTPGLLPPLQQPLVFALPQRTARAEGRGVESECARHLTKTMAGGPPHILPVAELHDLKAVLAIANIAVELWPDGALRELFDELTSLEAVLFSSQAAETKHGAARPSQRPPSPFDSLCSHLLLKRKVLYIHLLSDCGRLELMQRTVEDGKVEHSRICARLTDRTPPASLAVALIAEALGVQHDAVLQLDPYPIVSQGDVAPCAYPGVRCETTSYDLRMSVEGLPSHGLRKHGVDWVWRPAAAVRAPRNSPRGSPSSTLDPWHARSVPVASRDISPRQPASGRGSPPSPW